MKEFGNPCTVDFSAESRIMELREVLTLAVLFGHEKTPETFDRVVRLVYNASPPSEPRDPFDFGKIANIVGGVANAFTGNDIEHEEETEA